MNSITMFFNRYLVLGKFNKNNDFHLKDVIIELTKKELKVRYKHQVFGYLWSIANPLAFSLIYYIVFQYILGTRRENFALFLITALIPWQWIGNSLGVSPFTFIGNAPLIKKTPFPRNLIPFVVVLQDMIHFFLAIPVIVAFLLFAKQMPSFIWLLGIPIIALAQFMIIYSFSLVIASLNLFVRDMANIVNIFLQFIFYLSPIIWDISNIPSKFKSKIIYHPFATILVSWRKLFLENTLDFKYIMISLVYGVIFVILSHLIYKKLQWRFAEVL